MSVKNKYGLTENRERFCWAFVESGNATQSYREAFGISEDCKDHWLHCEASQLLTIPEVAQRIEMIREDMRKAKMYNVSVAMDELEEVRKAAFTAKEYAPTVSAIKAKMNLMGLEKGKKVSVDGNVQIDGLAQLIGEIQGGD